MIIKSLYQYLFENRDTNFENLFLEIKKINFQKDSLYLSDSFNFENFEQFYLKYIYEVIGSYRPVKTTNILVLLRESGEYVDVLLKNENFKMHPDKSKKAWGGSCSEQNDCPEGYYNCNWNGYQDYFAVGWEDHPEIWHGDIEVNDDAWEFLEENIHALIAEILVELTTYGNSYESREEFNSMISERIKDIKNIKDIKDIKDIKGEK